MDKIGYVFRDNPVPVKKRDTRITWKSDSEGELTIAFNDDGELLGWFEYERCGQFMHWKWYQDVDIGMTGGCLDEVRKQQKKLYGRKR